MLQTAHYFRAHTYTLVPHHLRDDMQWMADVGNTSVAVSLLEQDLTAAQWNLEHICREAERAAISVHVVPSRWAGLVAGAPKVASLFAASHPDLWAQNPDGSPAINEFSGPMCSIHHPAVYDFFCSHIQRMLENWPIAGLIWAELKNLGLRDGCPAAVEARGRDAPLERHVHAAAGFFDRVTGHARSIRPDLDCSLFIYAQSGDQAVRATSQMKHIQFFGCDGRPWHEDDATTQAPTEARSLLDHIDRFIEAARSAGKKPLALIENLDMRVQDDLLMDRRLPQLLEREIGHLLYYYYPRNLEDPEHNMAILRRHLCAHFRRRQGKSAARDQARA